MNKQLLNVMGEMINRLDPEERGYLNTLITEQRDDTDFQALAERFVSWAKSTGRCKGGFIKTPNRAVASWCETLHHDERRIVILNRGRILNITSVDGYGVKVYRIEGVPCRAVRSATYSPARSA